MVIMKQEHIYLNTELNALDYLRKVYYFLQKIDDSINWKWVVISLHGALYNLAISALKGTSHKNVTIKNKNDSIKLITISEAIKRCQNANCMKIAGNQNVLRLSLEQKESIKILNQELRNNIEHFIPNGTTIILSDFPDIVQNVLDVIEWFTNNTGLFTNIKIKDKQEIINIVSQCKTLLTKTNS